MGNENSTSKHMYTSFNLSLFVSIMCFYIWDVVTNSNFPIRLKLTFYPIVNRFTQACKWYTNTRYDQCKHTHLLTWRACPHKLIMQQVIYIKRITESYCSFLFTIAYKHDLWNYGSFSQNSAHKTPKHSHHMHKNHTLLAKANTSFRAISTLLTMVLLHQNSTHAPSNEEHQLHTDVINAKRYDV